MRISTLTLKILAISMVSFSFLASCVNDILEISSNSVSVDSVKSDLKKFDSDEEIILGKKLINPYSVQNMQIALNELKIKGSKSPIDKIEGNYYYLRLLPSTNEEYNLINSDSTIDTYEYPLDYEIIKQGNKFKDKTLSSVKFSWIYCAIPKEKKFPNNLKKEIIEELSLPFGNGKEAETQFQKSENGFLNTLEEESLVLTGNKKRSSKNLRAVAWYASGRIRVWDEFINYNSSTYQYMSGSGFVPVAQCNVRANRFFTTKSALTDNYGGFYINHGWGNGDAVNYSIKWEREDFDIRSGNYGQAYYNGPNILNQWNLDIEKASTPDNYMYAHVHRAANIYYYKNTFGVISPPKTNLFNLNKIHLGTNTGSLRSHYFAFNPSWGAAEVRLVFNLANDNAKSIFSTTIHELTHAAHWTLGMSYDQYCTNINQSARLAESWAQMVGWYITKQIYGPSGLNNTYYDQDAIQNTTIADMTKFGTCATNSPWYTPIFIDLIDNFNQNLWNSGLPVDKANGYTIQELQGFLIQRPVNWYKFRDVLKDNSSNSTETDAVQLFSDYD